MKVVSVTTTVRVQELDEHFEVQHEDERGYISSERIAVPVGANDEALRYVIFTGLRKVQAAAVEQAAERFGEES